jgi:hypothetical protein
MLGTGMDVLRAAPDILGAALDLPVVGHALRRRQWKQGSSSGYELGGIF